MINCLYNPSPKRLEKSAIFFLTYLEVVEYLGPWTLSTRVVDTPLIPRFVSTIGQRNYVNKLSEN